MSAFVELLGSKLLSKGAEIETKAALEGKSLIGLYFSAHWCPPCRQFTPLLNTVYNDWVKSGESFDLIFVSSDQDDEAFAEYHGTMDFKAIPYSDEEKRQALGEKFGIRGIPALYILNQAGEIVAKDGRTDIMKSKAQAIEGWKKQ